MSDRTVLIGFVALVVGVGLGLFTGVLVRQRDNTGRPQLASAQEFGDVRATAGSELSGPPRRSSRTSGTLGDGDALCASLISEGFRPRRGWTRHETGFYYCQDEIDVGEVGSQGLASTISFLAKSSRASGVESLTLALDLFNPTERTLGLARIRRIAGELSESIGEPLPQSVADAIVRGRARTVENRDVVIQWKPFRSHILTWRLVFAAKGAGERALENE